MLKIGLTGGIGSGKSTVADMFSRHGITIVDTDKIAREAVEPGQEALALIAEHFGPQILKNNGQLDRAKLRQQIFANPEKKHWLENLLHPIIRKHTTKRLEQAQSPYVILVSPLLFETEQDSLVDKTIVVDVLEATQIERASKRDGDTNESIKKIIESQIPREQRLSKANYIIDNDKSPEHTAKQVAMLHQQLLSSQSRH